MSKSILTIHKEILKKEYAHSPLGKLEKQLGDFYTEMQRKKEKLPEEIAEQIYNIRDENEKAMMKYVEDSQKRDKEEVDKLLFGAMSKEMEIINKYKSTAI